MIVDRIKIYMDEIGERKEDRDESSTDEESDDLVDEDTSDWEED